MKINIIDPALNSQNGHHFDWCQKIAEYLKISAGHDIWIYTHKNITESAKGKQLSITPTGKKGASANLEPEIDNSLLNELVLESSKLLAVNL